MATALAVAACRQHKRVRFTTAAEMVTELIEAKNQLELTRVRNRWTRYDLIVIAPPTAYILRGAASIIPGPDVVLCARVAHTRIAQLRSTVEKLRALDLRIHGLVLWDDNSPVIEAQDETEQPARNDSRDRDLVAAR